MLLISNPVCGDKSGPQFLVEQVLPLISSYRKSVKVIETTHTGHAGVIAQEYLATLEPESSATIIVSGGDGTLHEIVNALCLPYIDKNGVVAPIPAVSFALIPSGTANALYSTLFPPSSHATDNPDYKLKSIRSLMDSSSSVPLSLQHTVILDGGGVMTSQIISAVVTSTSLHAAILHTAEELRGREDLPGLMRFKAAAQQNILNWYKSQIMLIDPVGGKVAQYNPNTHSFQSPAQPTSSLPGPFEYFLSTINVDRLEPHFQITPLFSKLPPTEASMDLVVVRPNRNPRVLSDTLDDRTRFVETATTVLQSAYKEGKHVEFRYQSDGSCSEEGSGEPVVEYFRCGGWEWTPEPTDELAQLLCADGAILKIGDGGKASCRLVTFTNPDIQFRVFSRRE
ncbi:hypothetical protein SISNIDRAFT_435118 [Sistotremastrum niveocremeum HHB9708]|uniref:DAGKc domain-containing protein n=2 Tax=Sistotremastraceae TaxID=3402574 RepID=A0A165AMZ8_9AGAM|nr:hypothetical protein SISNIDRAFT_435118 [Sistotremastrum niveocremeum HHB9708]KZT36978.1 hypothetical protein SISSUDRAFT_1023458 [Sistotremastrum suecicum HHB10207 ss-3]